MVVFKSQDELDGFLWVHQLSSINELSIHLDIGVDKTIEMIGSYICKVPTDMPKSVVLFPTEEYGARKIRTTNFGGLFNETNERITNIYIREKNGNDHLFWRPIVARKEDNKPVYNNINIASMVIRGETGSLRPQNITYLDGNPRNLMLRNLRYGRGNQYKEVVLRDIETYSLPYSNGVLYLTEDELMDIINSASRLKEQIALDKNVIV